MTRRRRSEDEAADTGENRRDHPDEDPLHAHRDQRFNEHLEDQHLNRVWFGEAS